MFDLFSDPAKVAQQLQIISTEFGGALWETMYALILEMVFAYAIGLPLGVLLVTGEKEGIHPLPGWAMKALNAIINLLRSVPFLILMIITLPLSKIIVGTKVGTIATIPPMVIAAFPLVARMVETSLREVNHGVIEAAQSMGASTWQIVRKVYLSEARPSLILGGAMLALSLIMDKVLKKDTMGGGDIKLMALLGMFLTLPECLLMIMIACVVGIVMGSILMKVDSETPFPFGPALAIAAWITILVGNPIITWYLGLY